MKLPGANLHEYKLDPVLVQKISTKSAQEQKKWIRALTVQDKELFGLSEKCSKVDVHNSMKFSFSRPWNLNELNDPRNIETRNCYRNKCRSSCDNEHLFQEIWEADPTGKLMKNWSAGDMFGWLNVTDESNAIPKTVRVPGTKCFQAAVDRRDDWPLTELERDHDVHNDDDVKDEDQEEKEDKDDDDDTKDGDSV